MRGLRRSFLAISLSVFAAQCLSAQSSSPYASIETSKLQASLAKAIQILDVVENGKRPCYSADCQAQKYNLISEFFQKSSLLPEVGKALLQSRKDGVNSAYALVRKPFVPLSMENAFPESFREWKQWWVKRYDHENQTRSSWMQLVSEIYALRNGVEAYINLEKLDSNQLAMINEAWSRGLGRAAELLTSYPKLARETEIAIKQKLETKAQELRQKAAAEKNEFERINREGFNGQFYELLPKLFPQTTSTVQATALLALIQKWQNLTGSREIFDSAFISEMKYRLQELTDLVRIAQNFNNLEYGVIGLKNFYGDSNPEIRTELELIYQGFLDQVDAKGRLIVEDGSLYFFGIIEATVAGIITNQFDFHYSEYIWSKSTRTQELEARLSILKDDMERRRTELFETRKLVKAKIQVYDQELKRREQGE